MTDLQKAEWEQWQQICGRLLRAHAVSKGDLEAPVHADRTPGQKLLSDLRHWGNLRAQQGKEAMFLEVEG